MKQVAKNFLELKAIGHAGSFGRSGLDVPSTVADLVAAHMNESADRSQTLVEEFLGVAALFDTKSDALKKLVEDSLPGLEGMVLAQYMHFPENINLGSISRAILAVGDNNDVSAVVAAVKPFQPSQPASETARPALL